MSEQFKIIENKKMSEKNEIITGSLYQIALREVTNNELQQIDSDFYMSISDFIGKIRDENYDGIESKINRNLAEFITELTTLILRIRIGKIKKLPINTKKLLDIENPERIAKLIQSGSTNDQSYILGALNHLQAQSIIDLLKKGQAVFGISLGPVHTETEAEIFSLYPEKISQNIQ